MKFEAQNGSEIHGASVDTEKLEFNFEAGDELCRLMTSGSGTEASNNQPCRQCKIERGRRRRRVKG